MPKEQQTLEELYVAIKANYDQLKQDFKNVRNLSEREGEKSGKGFGKGFNAILKKGVILLAIKKVLDFGKAAITASADMEMLELRLSNLYGSAEKGAEVFKKLEKIASTTPFEVSKVVEAGAQMKAFGLDAELTTKVAADLAAYMGTDIVDAANAMGRAFAGGAGAADILRERGVLNLIKMKTGIQDLTKMTLPQFRQAMLTVFTDTSGTVAGSTDKMKESFNGMVSNLWDGVTRLADAIGDLLMPVLKPAIQFISDAVDWTGRWVKKMSEGEGIMEAAANAIKEQSDEERKAAAEKKNSANSQKEVNVELKNYIELLGKVKMIQREALAPNLTFGEDYEAEKLKEKQAKIKEYYDARYRYGQEADGMLTRQRIKFWDGVEQIDNSAQRKRIQEKIAAEREGMEQMEKVWEAGASALITSGLMTVWNEMTEDIRENANMATQIVLNMVDAMIQALVQLAAKMAIIQMLNAISPGAGTALGTAAGAVGAQHGFNGIPVKKMQGGGDFTVPHGFQNDKFPMLVDSGERVTVQTRAGAASQDALMRSLIGRIEALNMNQVRSKNSEVNVSIEGESRIRKGDIYKSYEKQSQLRKRYV